MRCGSMALMLLAGGAHRLLRNVDEEVGVVLLPVDHLKGMVAPSPAPTAPLRGALPRLNL
jgi:hypothetical protein